jgi:hypothetical protein
MATETTKIKIVDRDEIANLDFADYLTLLKGTYEGGEVIKLRGESDRSKPESILSQNQLS